MSLSTTSVVVMVNLQIQQTTRKVSASMVVEKTLVNTLKMVVCVKSVTKTKPCSASTTAAITSVTTHALRHTWVRLVPLHT